MEDNLKDKPEDNTNDGSENNSDASKKETETPEEKTTSKEETRYIDFYIRLRQNIDKQLKDSYNNDSPINKAINLLALLPDLLHLNIKLLFDGDVRADKKGAIVAAILYVISPIDLIPDIIPALGWLDDLLVVTMGLNALLDDTKDKQINETVEKYWAGDLPVFDTLQHVVAIIDSAVEFLPRKLMKIVKDLLRGK